VPVSPRLCGSWSAVIVPFIMRILFVAAIIIQAMPPQQIAQITSAVTGIKVYGLEQSLDPLRLAFLEQFCIVIFRFVYSC
jgi:hypothetical protein